MTAMPTFDAAYVGSTDVARIFHGSALQWQRRVPYLSAVLADNPVGLWLLDDAAAGSVATDSAGTYPGTYTGACAAGPGPGGAVATVLTAGTGHIRIPTVAALRPVTAASIEVWFKTTGTAAITEAGIFAPPVAATGPYGIDLFIINNRLRLEVDAGGIRNVISPVDVNDAAWHHAVGTYTDGDGMHLYLDGVLVAADATWASGIINYRSNGFIGIGVRDDPGNYYFTGSVARAAIYDKVLSAARVAAHFAA